MKDIVIALPDDKELNLEHRIEITHQIVDAMEWVQNGLGIQTGMYICWLQSEDLEKMELV
ncbi:hypothetical protein [Orientia tsutsugamushi]|uniref:hypothetical protein n=1 Tax=Orientia tsutsugamushi TaxID=784 RepID=UPI00397DAB66